MVLEFCPVCKSLLKLKEENGKTIGYCSCGFKRTSGIDLSSVDKEKKSTIRAGGVISNQDNIEGFDHICKKCSHDKAEVMDLGENSTNESNIYLYRCLKCGNIERQSIGAGNF
ncbi:MAG: hypothetical protein Q8N99_03935 [Nanoarchaeota archaeon]|nr:hypothetical protein [Nanoarchaeota archaeon]